MIQSLHIQNYAIIDHLEVDLVSGLNIITGETGAGKSILLGATGLILGQRANSKSLLYEDKKCIIEGRFAIRDYDLKAFFDTYDLDYDDETIIRREILPSGKSRAFINDTPVSLNILSALAGQLVDLHQQFDTLQLQETSFQVKALDALADHQKVLNKYKQDFETFALKKTRLRKLESIEHQNQKEADFLSFQSNELNEAAISENEEGQLEASQGLLENTESIQAIIGRAQESMEESDFAVIPILQNINTQLIQLGTTAESITSLQTSLQSIIIEISEWTRQAENVAGQLDADPARLMEVNDRLDLLYRLFQKHQVQNSADLLAVQSDIEERLSAIEGADAEIAQLKSEIILLQEELEKTAQKITTGRKKAGKIFEKAVLKRLEHLHMDNAVLKIEIDAADSFTRNGKDLVTYLFSANKGGQLLPIKQVASGGELSRLSLCIKSVVAEKMHLPTLIFDEIDAGISGEVALKMGSIIEKLALEHQILMITHSPQIASKASQHLYVKKQDKGRKTTAKIEILNDEEKINELAKMLSGNPPSEAAILNAKSLLDIN